VASVQSVSHEELMGSVGASSAAAMLKWDLEMLQSLNIWLAQNVEAWENTTNPLRDLAIPQPRSPARSPRFVADPALAERYQCSPVGLPSKVHREVLPPPSATVWVPGPLTPAPSPVLLPPPHTACPVRSPSPLGGTLKRRQPSKVVLGGRPAKTRQGSRRTESRRALSPIRTPTKATTLAHETATTPSLTHSWSVHGGLAPLPRRTGRRAPPNWNHTAAVEAILASGGEPASNETALPSFSDSVAVSNGPITTVSPLREIDEDLEDLGEVPDILRSEATAALDMLMTVHAEDAEPELLFPSPRIPL